MHSTHGMQEARVCVCVASWSMQSDVKFDYNRLERVSSQTATMDLRCELVRPVYV